MISKTRVPVLPLLNRRGAALMFVLGVAILLAITLGLVLSLSFNRAKSTHHGTQRVKGLYCAEAGYWAA